MGEHSKYLEEERQIEQIQRRKQEKKEKTESMRPLAREQRTSSKEKYTVLRGMELVARGKVKAEPRREEVRKPRVEQEQTAKRQVEMPRREIPTERGKEAPMTDPESRRKQMTEQLNTIKERFFKNRTAQREMDERVRQQPKAPGETADPQERIRRQELAGDMSVVLRMREEARMRLNQDLMAGDKSNVGFYNDFINQTDNFLHRARKMEQEMKKGKETTMQVERNIDLGGMTSLRTRLADAKPRGKAEREAEAALEASKRRELRAPMIGIMRDQTKKPEMEQTRTRMV